MEAVEVPLEYRVSQLEIRLQALENKFDEKFPNVGNAFDENGNSLCGDYLGIEKDKPNAIVNPVSHCLPNAPRSPADKA